MTLRGILRYPLEGGESGSRRHPGWGSVLRTIGARIHPAALDGTWLRAPRDWREAKPADLGDRLGRRFSG